MRYLRLFRIFFIGMSIALPLHATFADYAAAAPKAECKTGYSYDAARGLCVSGSNSYLPPTFTCAPGQTYVAERKVIASDPNLKLTGPAGCYANDKPHSLKPVAEPKLVCERQGYVVNPADNAVCIDEKDLPKYSGRASEQQKIDETYARFGNSLDRARDTYFKGKGKHLCSSQGCNDGPWKKIVYQCSQQTRQTIAGAGRYGETVDDEKAKELLGACIEASSGVPKDITRAGTKDTDLSHIFKGASAANEQACTEFGGTWNGTSCDTAAKDGEAANPVACSVEHGMGWLICPSMQFLASIMDSSFNFLSGSFLKTDYRLLDNDDTRKAWSMMQQLANVAFVIIFLIIIYSQVTGGGISSYNVRTMLPRLLIAAILVNVSFILCQIAVDISNLAGFSLKEFFDGLGSAITVGNDIHDTTATPRALSAVGEMALILGAAGGAAAIILALSFPVILAGVLALGLIVLILIGRTAFIVILTIIAPLAFTAWVLPNTRSLFNKWGKTFFSLLMLFPIISVVFGASNFVASLLQSPDLVKQNEYGVMSLMALAVSSIPLFVVPGLLKGALNATGQLGAKLSGVSSTLNSRVGKKVSETSRLGEMRQQQKFRSIQRRANRRAGNSWFARQGRKLATNSKSEFMRGLGHVMSAKGNMTRAIDGSPVGKFLGGRAGAAAAAATASKADNEQVEAAKILMESGVDPNKLPSIAEAKLREAIAKGDTISARAAQKILLGSGAPGIQALQDTLKSLETGGEMAKSGAVATSLRQDLNAAGIKDRDAVLSAWSYNNKSIEATLRDAGTFSGLTATELAGQGTQNIAAGVNSGGITRKAYLELQTIDAARAKLTDSKRAEFDKAP